MLAYPMLKKLTLEALRRTPETQFVALQLEVEKLADQKNVFPTREEEPGPDWNEYYRERRLSKRDTNRFKEIIWDLVIGHILVIGNDDGSQAWPFFSLTDFGESVIARSQEPHYYDPEGYLRYLDSISSDMSPVIKQYALEALHSFQSHLYFASAVMIGAAAETTTILLLEAVAKSKKDDRRKKQIEKLLENIRLPKMFQLIQSEINMLIEAKSLPFSVHQGCMEHLLSLFEMIRAHRNDAVHPRTGEVDKTKALLALQSFPGALEVVYRLIKWFSENEI